jgi:hypothetical protein
MVQHSTTPHMHICSFSSWLLSSWSFHTAFLLHNYHHFLFTIHSILSSLAILIFPAQWTTVAWTLFLFRNDLTSERRISHKSVRLACLDLLELPRPYTKANPACQLPSSISNNFSGWIDNKKTQGEKGKKTYNSRDLLVVTHITTNWPACGLNVVNTWVGALAGDGRWCWLLV